MTHTKDEALKLAKECGATTYTNRHYPEAAAVTFSPLAWEKFCEQAFAAPPVQEPVAQWQLRHHLHTDGIWENCTESEAAVMQKQAHFEIRPLYTTPPAAPVPLTDEQIDEIVNRLDPLFLDVPESFTTDFAQAIEAAHGITGKGQNGPATLNQPRLEGKP